MKLARSVRLKGDAIKREISDHAILNVQSTAGVERDASSVSDADPIERHAAYIDLVGRAGSDSDRRSVSRRCDVGPALALDGDGVADRERAVRAPVQRIDLASWTGHRH